MIDPATAVHAAAIDAFLIGRAVGMIGAEQAGGSVSNGQDLTRMAITAVPRRFGLLRIEAAPIGSQATEPLCLSKQALLIIGIRGDDHGQVRGWLRSHGGQGVVLFKPPQTMNIDAIRPRVDLRGPERAAKLITFSALKLDVLWAALQVRECHPEAWTVGLKTMPRFSSREATHFSPLICA